MLRNANWMPLLLFGALCISTNAQATTIIGLRTNSALFIAADSKIVAVNGPEARSCKVLVSPNHIFAEAGLFRETRGPFDVFATAKKIIDAGSDHDTIVSSFQTEMMAVLPRVFAEVRSQSSEYFQAVMRNAQPVQAIFGTFEKTVIRLSYIGFSIKDDPASISVVHMDCPGSACDVSKPWLVELGEHDAVDAELSNNHQLWKTYGIPGTLNRLITMQANAKPNFVAPPIAIAAMVQDGRTGWVQAGECVQ